MNNLLLLFTFFLFVVLNSTYHTLADFVLPVSLTACEDCCIAAGKDNSECKDSGCNLLNSGIRCDNLFPSSTSDLAACGIGRDFIFTGRSGLGENSPTLRCVDTNGSGQLVTEDLPDFIEQISVQDCQSCCDQMGDIPGSNNDFPTNDCNVTCITGNACFDDEDHRDRFSCLIGLDLRTQAQVTYKDEIHRCSDGVLTSLPQASFPTVQPTSSDEESREVLIYISSTLILLGITSFCIALVCMPKYIAAEKAKTSLDGTELAKSTVEVRPRVLETSPERYRQLFTDADAPQQSMGRAKPPHFIETFKEPIKAHKKSYTPRHMTWKNGILNIFIKRETQAQLPAVNHYVSENINRSLHSQPLKPAALNSGPIRGVRGNQNNVETFSQVTI